MLLESPKLQFVRNRGRKFRVRACGSDLSPPPPSLTCTKRRGFATAFILRIKAGIKAEVRRSSQTAMVREQHHRPHRKGAASSIRKRRYR